MNLQAEGRRIAQKMGILPYIPCARVLVNPQSKEEIRLSGLNLEAFGITQILGHAAEYIGSIGDDASGFVLLSMRTNPGANERLEFDRVHLNTIKSAFSNRHLQEPLVLGSGTEVLFTVENIHVSKPIEVTISLTGFSAPVLKELRPTLVRRPAFLYAYASLDAEVENYRLDIPLWTNRLSWRSLHVGGTSMRNYLVKVDVQDQNVFPEMPANLLNLNFRLFDAVGRFTLDNRSLLNVSVTNRSPGEQSFSLMALAYSENEEV